MVGELPRALLDELADRDGVTLAQALEASGLDPDSVGDAKIDFDAVHAFVELHIEQGGVLEAGGETIGIVTSIAAPHELRMRLRGVANHAGATPMTLRHDALAGAAELIFALEKLARDSPSGTTVGTVGVIRALPGAINVVPGDVVVEVDVRDSDLAARKAVVDTLLVVAEKLCERRGLTLEIETIAEDRPAHSSPTSSSRRPSRRAASSASAVAR